MNIVTIDANRTNVHQATSWAIDNFGLDSFDLETFWPAAVTKFNFANPQHATHFALRWL